MKTIAEAMARMTPARRHAIGELALRGVLFKGHTGYARKGSKPIQPQLIKRLVDLDLVRSFTVVKEGRSFAAAQLTDIGAIVADRLREQQLWP